MSQGASGEQQAEQLAGLPKAGDVIGGKFVVEGVLGVGGMGAVLSARHAHLGQKVAIKVLLRHAARAPEAVARFLREAKTAVGLQSAHVVRVMDVGTLDDGLPYMVMEHLTGTDLDALLAARKTVRVEEAVGFVLQAMEAIAEAHAAGLVHRDLKPANLFLTTSPDGSALVKVLDFGISKSSSGGSGDQSLTATTAIMGSPLYMSPEQLRSSKKVDARTDIWALGVILYELVAGRPPFEDETVTGLCSKIAADLAVPLRTVRPEIPAPFDAVVMACLQKDATLRPQTVGDLAAALRPFAPGEAALAVDRILRISGPANARPPPSAPLAPASDPSASGAAHSATATADTVATWNTPGTGRRRRTSAILAAFAAVTVAGGLAVAVVLARGAHPAAAPSEPPVAAAPPSVPAPPAAVLTAAPAPADTPAPSASAADVRLAPLPGAPAAPSKPSWLGAAPTPRPSAKPTGAPGATGTAPKPTPEDLLLDRK
jgi:eukaryotic-like serine/threonine-protein kinase